MAQSRLANMSYLQENNTSHPGLSRASLNSIDQLDFKQIFDGFDDDFVVSLQYEPDEEAEILSQPESSTTTSTKSLISTLWSRSTRLYEGKPWITALHVAYVLSLAVLLGNLILVIIACASPHGGSGPMRVLDPKGKKTQRDLSAYYHVIINVFSTILLVSSNYAMQILTAPTREEIDDVHKNGKWLEVGLMSVHNLRYIRKSRVLLWFCLAFSSVPLHLFYNSSVIEVVQVSGYQFGGINVVMGKDPDSVFSYLQLSVFGIYSWLEAAPRSFIQGTGNVTLSYGKPEPYILRLKFDGEWRWQPWQSKDYGLPAVGRCSNYTEITTTTALIAPPPMSIVANISVGAQDIHLSFPNNEGLLFFEAAKKITDLKIQCGPGGSFRITPETIRFIKARQPSGASSRSQIILPLMGVVLLANIVKSLALYFTIQTCKKDLLITVGDAISSFLERPDRVLPAPFDQEKEWPFCTVQGRYWKQKQLRCRDTIGGAPFPSVVLTVTLFGFIILLYFTYFMSMAVATDDSTIWTQWGARSSLAVESTNHSFDNRWIYINTIVANSPQFLLSIGYFNINRLCTGMYTAQEWNRYATDHHALRTTSPKGFQKSTHYLQLPWRLAIPLIVASGILHWLLSQALFLTRIDVQESSDLPVILSRSACGFSILSMTIFVGLLFVILLLVGLCLHRRVTLQMPASYQRSDFISATCHPPTEDVDPQLNKIRWGVVRHAERDISMTYCTFTSHDVEGPQEGMEYSWMRQKETMFVKPY